MKNENDYGVVEKEIISFFEVALKGTSAEIKKAKIIFKKNTKNLFGKRFTSKQWFLLLSIIEKSKEINENNKANFISSLKDIVFYIPKKESHFMVDFIIDNILSENGNVRQATINFFDWWRITETGSFRSKEKEELSKNLYNLFLKIKDLIKEHQPENVVISDNFSDDPTYLNELNPSVYKSLLLFWEKGTGDPYMQEILVKYPELQIIIPKRNYDDESWLTENEIDPEEEALNLWNKQIVDMEIFSALSILEAMAKDRFIKELNKLNFDKDFSKGLIKNMKDHFTFLGEDVDSFQEMVTEYISMGIKPEETDFLVRAFLSFANHRIIENDNKEPMSPILVSVAVAKSEMERKEPKDMKNFILHVRDTHLSIDTFCEQFTRKETDRKRDYLNSLKNSNLNSKQEKEFLCHAKEALEKNTKETEKALMQCCSIAHHIFDWYVQVESWGVLNKSPEKLTALAYFSVRKFNFDNDCCYAEVYNNNDLSEFGGWKGNNITGSSDSFYYSVCHSVGDPQLLRLRP